MKAFIFKHNAKLSQENLLPLPWNPRKNEMTLLSYDINDHVYSK